MKKVLGFLLILLALPWLGGCASNQGLVKNGGDGSVEVSQSLFNRLEQNDPNKSIYYTSNEDFLINRRLDQDGVQRIDDYSGEYLKFLKMENQTFWIFQAEIDEADSLSIANFLWIVRFSPDGQYEFLNGDLVSEDNQKETMTGSDEGFVPIESYISAVKMSSTDDKSHNANYRYSKPYLYFISWDTVAFFDVEYVKQAEKRVVFADKKIALKGGETIDYKEEGNLSHENKKTFVGTGSNNEVLIDIRQGNYIQLCKTVDGQEALIKIDPLEMEKLKLIGLEAVEFPLLGEYWLKIIEPPDEANSHDKKVSPTNTKKKHAHHGSRKKSVVKYTLKQKYPEGYCVVDVPELKSDESKLYDLCVSDGDINPKIDQKDVIVGFNYLKTHGSDSLYEKYKNKVIKP